MFVYFFLILEVISISQIRAQVTAEKMDDANEVNREKHMKRVRRNTQKKHEAVKMKSKDRDNNDNFDEQIGIFAHLLILISFLPDQSQAFQHDTETTTTTTKRQKKPKPQPDTTTTTKPMIERRQKKDKEDNYVMRGLIYMSQTISLIYCLEVIPFGERADAPPTFNENVRRKFRIDASDKVRVYLS
jgi:hypothetical protein